MGGYSLAMRAEAPAWMREQAEASAAEAAKLLGLPSPAIRWHKGEGPSLGWVDREDPGAIHLNITGLSRKDVYQVKALTFHEIRHLWQDVTGRYLDRRQGEEDAQAWSYQRTGVMLDLIAPYEY